MYNKITINDTFPIALDELGADASDLGYFTERWSEMPRQLPTDLGNGQPFLLWSMTSEVAIYRQGNGVLVLRVYND